MAVAGNVSSFFSRFAIRLLEIIGAGIATAIGGYLVAHLGAYLTSSTPGPSATPATPAAVQAAPNATVATKAPRLQPAAGEVAPAAAPVQDAAPAPKEGAAPPPRMTPKATEASAVSANEGKAGLSREAALARKAAKTEPGTIESKPREAETKPADNKSQDMNSVEAEVRAALAKVDASRPVPPEAPYQPVIAPTPTPPVVVVPPKPAEAAVGSIGTVAATPPAAAVAAPPSQQPQPAQAPVEAVPLGTVEIKSQPVTAPVDAVPPAATAEASSQNRSADAHEDSGLFSAIKRIPDILRPGAGATTKDPPRPPMPVGDDP